ncbi:MAG: SOS response-associated peptidase [Phycisphaerales bacterium]
MCGRFLNTHPSREIARAFRVMMDRLAQESFATWNIAPSQPIRAVRVGEDGDRSRELVALRWGFVPSWSKAPDDGPRPINARAETVATSGAFRSAFARRRCVIPASGFYEWRRIEGQRTKQPFAIVPTSDDGLFAFAGVWERWGDDLETCAIITTAPNAVMKPIHDRMPAILGADAIDAWLDPDAPKDRLAEVLGPSDPAGMRAYPVSRHVNTPAHDDPRCLEPVAEENSDGGGLFQGH